MKNLKKTSKLFIFLVLAMVLGITNVFAATEYKIKEIEDYSYADATSKGYPIQGGGQTNPHSHFEIKNNATGTVLGKGYCMDPGLATPDGDVLQDVTSTYSADKISKLTTLCQSLTGDDLYDAGIVKAYSVAEGWASAGTETFPVYQNVMSGKATWVLDDRNLKKDVQQIIDAGGAVVSNASFSKKGNKLILTTNVAGTLKANNIPKGYVVKVNNTDFSGELPINNAGTFTITIATDSTQCEDTSVTISFTFSYDESLTNNGMVAKILAKSGESKQKLLFCDPNGGSNSCENGKCDINESITTTCEPNVCEEPNPEISTPGFDSNGNAICDGNGNTIVNINESPSGVDAERSEIACIADEEHDATNAILGSDNDYCNIYCTEKVELMLSGPDFRNGDDEMFINAGTYFEITGPLTQTDEITCYGEMHFEKFEEDVRTLRANVVKTYNEWQEQQAIADNKLNKYQQTITKTDSEGNPYTENIGCDVSVSYQGLKMGSDGKITPDLKTADVPYSGKNCSDAVNLPNTATEAKTAYNTAVTNANTKIPEAEGKWKSCTTWNFDNLETTIETKEKNCYTDITFSYDDGAVDVNLESIEFNSGSTGSIASGSGTTKINVGVCDSNGSNCNKYNSGYDVSKSFINNSATINIEYKFDNGFAIDYKTNAIYKGSDAEECIAAGNCSDMIYGFPIDIDTPQGIGTYQYEYSGIGHNWNDMAIGVCSMGRFDGDIEDYDTYMCYYNVNSCEDCEVECDGDGCALKIPECVDEGCKVACVGGGCILDINAGFLATFRTISLNDEGFAEVALLSASPNTLLAYNSSTNFGKSNWDNEKGRNASAEISDKGESIYGGEPEYSITLTPSVINQIKGYNEDNESNGGYLNDTLTCKDISGKDYGLCISSFIHEEFKQSFGINKGYNTTTGEIEGKEIYYTPYNSSEAFQGPAWK